MQFIEKNSFSVRSAVYCLKKDGSALEFVIFPMVHVGSPQFYDEVSRRLESCDLILAEGVKSKRVKLLTRSYRIVKHIRRIGLVTQQDGMRVEALRAKILNADIDAGAFDDSWSSLSLWLRAQLFVLIPIWVLYLLLFGTREVLADNLALDDLPSQEEILEEDEDFAPLHTLLIDGRDRILLEQVAKLLNQNQHARRIAIVFGAEHMRNAMKFLMQSHKYYVAKAEWVTVFDL